MSEIIIDCGRLYKTVAWLENDQTTRIRFFKNEEASILNTVYLGRVVGLAKSLDSAFVEIGLDKPGFLHFRDFPTKTVEGHEIKLKMGDSVLVQVSKEPVGEKAAKLTGFVNVRGLHAVLLPFEKGVFVSKEINSKSERIRLKKMAEACLPKGFGMVIRTLSEGKDEESFRGVVESLVGAWESMTQTATWAYPPKVLLKSSWTDNLLESLLKNDISTVTVNHADLFESLQKRLGKEDRKRILFHDNHSDLLAERGVRTAMEQLLGCQLQLPSGGYVTVDLTEAMTVYDVNSGAMVTEGKMSQTVKKLNDEALWAVMNHMTLANIGGMIMVDLVNMASPKDQDRLVLWAQEEAARRNEGIQVYGLTKLGLLEMTRTRETESFYGVVGGACQHCGATGWIKRSEWLYNELAGRLDAYKAQGFTSFQIVTTGSAVPIGLKESIRQHGIADRIEVTWEEQLLDEKFSYKIRPFR